MTEQLKEARKRYTVSKFLKGTTSAHNDDDVATLLAGNTPENVCSTAEKLAGIKARELGKKYGHLNPSQVRMCAGKRTRAMVNKGAVSVDEVAEVLAAQSSRLSLYGLYPAVLIPIQQSLCCRVCGQSETAQYRLPGVPGE